MKRIPFIIAILFFQFAGHAQTPDWSTDVAPIIYNNCTSCHHNGAIAPFALMTYDEAATHASLIKNDVLGRTMPPWPPDPNYSHLAHERILSTAEINTIVNWVDGGAPSGTLSLAPPPPVYSNTGMLPGTPDLVVRIPNYISTADTADVYQCFVIPSGLLADRYIVGLEGVPGNPAIVHHVLVYSDTMNTCASLDSAYPGPGYPDYGGVGSGTAVLVGGWAPGGQPLTLPPGFGIKLPHQANIIVQIHYPAGTAGQTDSTEVHFFLTPVTGSMRNVTIAPLLYHLLPCINAPLFIPANTTQTFVETVPSVTSDMSVLGIAPHMHLIGRSIKSYAIDPAGDTAKLISIPEWDTHWQGIFMFPKIKKIPAGSSLKAEAFYDNTTANPENPNSPPQDVSLGDRSVDEMMLVFFVYTNYLPGDDTIIIDTICHSHGDVLNTPQTAYYHGQQLLDVAPNPAVSDIVVKCYLEEADKGSIELTDITGRVVRQFMLNAPINAGYSAFTYDITGLSPGTYILGLNTTQRRLTQKIIVR